MGKRNKQAKVDQRLQGRAAADAAYRKALGLDGDGELPKQVGASGSAGGSRGGRGAAQKRRGGRRAHFE